MTNKKTILHVISITKYYEQVKALDSVTLSVSSGTILGLVGPNGAGKTTLIKILAGIIKPDLGTVRIDGSDLFFDYFTVRRNIGYLPEKIVLYPTLTGYEFLKFMAGLYDLPEELFNERYEKYAKFLKITDYVTMLLGTLSKGMLQKIVLTAILMREPKIYLLDEPFYGLDPEGIWLLKKVLREKADEGATVLISSHILPLVEEFCDKIVILHQGKKYVDGTPKEVRNWIGTAESLEEVFLKITKSSE